MGLLTARPRAESIASEPDRLTVPSRTNIA
jgi:hypothetical protein